MGILNLLNGIVLNSILFFTFSINTVLKSIYVSTSIVSACSTVLHPVYPPFFTCPFSQWWGPSCFSLLTDNAVMKILIYSPSRSLWEFLWDKFRSRIAYLRNAYCLSESITNFLSIMARAVYTPTSNAWGFLYYTPHSRSANPWIYLYIWTHILLPPLLDCKLLKGQGLCCLSLYSPLCLAYSICSNICWVN